MNLTPHTYATQRERVVDSVIGFVGFLVGNGLLFLAYILVSQVALQSAAPAPTLALSLLVMACLFAPWLVNIAALIYFGVTRSQIALGMLLAVGTLLALALIAGVVLVITCFANLGRL